MKICIIEKIKKINSKKLEVNFLYDRKTKY